MTAKQLKEVEGDLSKILTYTKDDDLMQADTEMLVVWGEAFQFTCYRKNCPDKILTSQQKISVIATFFDLPWISDTPEFNRVPIPEKITAQDELSYQDIATVLVALRVYQQMGGPPPGILHDIATNGGEFPPMTVEQIDGLSQRLNFKSSVR